MKLHPWIKRYFAADGAAVAGGASSAETQTSQAAVAPATTGDILSTDAFAAELTALDAPTAQPDANKPVEPVKPAAAKPEEPKKPEDKKDGIKSLREQYDKTKAELEAALKEKGTLASEREELQKKITEFESAKAALEKERDSYKEAGEEHYKRLLFHEPEVAKEFKVLDDALNADLTEPFETIPGLSKDYNNLLGGYARLPWGKPDMAEKHTEFRADLKEKFPDDWQAVEKALQRGVKHLREERALRDRLKTESTEFQHSKRVEAWENYAKRFDGNAKNFFSADPEALKADPYHPVAFVAALAEKDSKLAGFLKQATDYARNVYLGPKPLSQKDFAGLDDAQIGEKLAQATDAHERNRDGAVQMIARGLAYEALFRPLVAEVKKLRELVEKSKTAEPPEPNADKTRAATDASEMPSTRDVANDILKAG